jgi:magnesium transporter
MLDRRNDQLMNRRLNILTVWSTIFLPLSFYTGLWGMNFDDVPLISDDNGFWVFSALSIITIAGLWWYFKKHKWI